MAITIGLDFGTHQTKICIEDTADKQNPHYSFWKFKDTKGQRQLVCPSVVQVNVDNTLSYGFVSDDNCKKGFHIDYKEPRKPTLEKPTLILPEPAIPYEVPDIVDEKELTSEELSKYKEIKARIENTNRSHRGNYNLLCQFANAHYNAKLKRYNDEKIRYEQQLAKWQKQTTTPAPIRYFYFKQAVFSIFEWRYREISPLHLSVWYIANILFDLEDKYGQDFSIQMGVPTGAKDLDSKKQLATSILLSAYKLVEDTFGNNKEKFLSTTIEDLLSVTEIVPYSADKKQEYGIKVFPEAYAGLRMIASRGKIVNGLSLNVDIGGGTTDLSFFTIQNNKPHIYRYESMPIGINWIVQEAFGKTSILKQTARIDTLSTSQNKSAQQRLSLAIQSFHKQLTGTQISVIKTLYEVWFLKNGTQNSSSLNQSLQNRPVIYMGGGSTYKQLRKAISKFSEIHIVNDKFWSSTNIENVGNLYPVLNTALGLSVGEVNDDIEIHSISDLWGDVTSSYSDDIQEDYNLMDMN